VEDEKAREKREAILTMLGGKKLMKLSRARVFFVPQMWVKIYGWEVDGNVWVSVRQENGGLVIGEIDQKEAQAMMEANNVPIS